MSGAEPFACVEIDQVRGNDDGSLDVLQSGGDQLARRVVDEHQQRTGITTILELAMLGAINLHQLAQGLTAQPRLMELRRCLRDSHGPASAIPFEGWQNVLNSIQTGDAAPGDLCCEHAGVRSIEGEVLSSCTHPDLKHVNSHKTGATCQDLHEHPCAVVQDLVEGSGFCRSTSAFRVPSPQSCRSDACALSGCINREVQLYRSMFEQPGVFNFRRITTVGGDANPVRIEVDSERTAAQGANRTTPPWMKR